MLSIAFPGTFLDFRGVEMGIAHLARGFSTISAGEGFGRVVVHEDSKEEKRASAVTQSPKSIDDIILPFFAKRGKGLESVAHVGYFSGGVAAKRPTHPIGYQAVVEHASFMPSSAFDVKSALLYARSGSDYLSAQNYEAAPPKPAKAEVRYAAKSSSSSLVPPRLEAHYVAQKAIYTLTEQKSTSASPAPPLSKSSMPYAISRYLPSAIERAVIHYRVSVPVYRDVPVVPAMLQQINAAGHHKTYQSPTFTFQKEIQTTMPNILPMNGPMSKVRDYVAKPLQSSVEYVKPIVTKYVAPLLTAVGLSMAAPALSAKRETQILQPSHQDLAVVVEKHAKAEPKTVEKVKRELPKYERKDIPPELEEITQGMEGHFGGEVAFYVIDFKNGNFWGRNEKKVMRAASMSKQGIIYAAMEMFEEGKLDLGQRIDVSEMMARHKGIVPKNYGKLKEGYSVREILAEINKDDNNNSNLFANLMLTLLGHKEVNRRMAKNRFGHTSFYNDTPYREDYDKNFTTAEEAALLNYELSTPSRWSKQAWEELQGIIYLSEKQAHLALPPSEVKKGTMSLSLTPGKHGNDEYTMSEVARVKDQSGRNLFDYGVVLIHANVAKPMLEPNMVNGNQNGMDMVNVFVPVYRALVLKARTDMPTLVRYR